MSKPSTKARTLLLQDAAKRADKYLDGLDRRRVAPSRRALAGLSAFDRPMPRSPVDGGRILSFLDTKGSPATVATAGGRYFGFVIGGALPATLAANWLAGAWDQCNGAAVLSPAAVKIEDTALRWLQNVLRLPSRASGGFVTGATMANFTGLAAARHRLLARAGWDVESRGLFGAPEIRVVVGDEVHVSVLKALALLGLGHGRITRVPADDQGRMRVDALPRLDERTIVCVQAGNVNTGAFDDVIAVYTRAGASGAWVHVDGAFGLWARASPRLAGLARGFEKADSWSIDAHKWLNVPYDSGIALCRDMDAMKVAMSVNAPYLQRGGGREPHHYTPEMSRRARSVEIWAALSNLGRSGLADLLDRTCRHARRFAEGLSEAGHEILNDVVLNQVLVRFGDDETTNRVVAAIQEDGTCWCGGTVFKGSAAMRISVSSWATTEGDVEESLGAMLRIAKTVAALPRARRAAKKRR